MSNENDYMSVLKEHLDEANLAKLTALKNPAMHRFVADAIELCKPARVFVSTDDAEDIAYIRQLALDLGEEKPLAMEGHTVHYDGYYDQARDVKNTAYLLPEGVELDKRINSVPRKEGLEEIFEYFKGSMAGKTMLVRFFCLGPTNSIFSIPCVQITDSAYVAPVSYTHLTLPTNREV